MKIFKNTFQDAIDMKRISLFLIVLITTYLSYYLNQLNIILLIYLTIAGILLNFFGFRVHMFTIFIIGVAIGGTIYSGLLRYFLENSYNSEFSNIFNFFFPKISLDSEFSTMLIIIFASFFFGIGLVIHFIFMPLHIGALCGAICAALCIATIYATGFVNEAIITVMSIIFIVIFSIIGIYFGYLCYKFFIVISTVILGSLSLLCAFSIIVSLFTNNSWTIISYTTDLAMLIKEIFHQGFIDLVCKTEKQDIIVFLLFAFTGFYIQIRSFFSNSKKVINTKEVEVLKKKDNDNIVINMTIYADFFKRFNSFILDLIILISILYLIELILAFIFSPIFQIVHLNESIQEDFFVFMFYLGAWMYFPLMESSHRQATFGKVLLGIKVTDLHYRRISFMKANLRLLGKLISMILIGFGFIIIAFTKKKQGLHDIISKCLVIKNVVINEVSEKKSSNIEINNELSKQNTQFIFETVRQIDKAEENILATIHKLYEQNKNAIYSNVRSNIKTKNKINIINDYSDLPIKIFLNLGLTNPFTDEELNVYVMILKELLIILENNQIKLWNNTNYEK